jgi:hypothetical protein
MKLNKKLNFGKEKSDFAQILANLEIPNSKIVPSFYTKINSLITILFSISDQHFLPHNLITSSIKH